MERLLYEQVYKLGEKCKVIKQSERFFCRAFCPVHSKCSQLLKDCITKKYYVIKDEMFYNEISFKS